MKAALISTIVTGVILVGARLVDNDATLAFLRWFVQDFA